MPQSTQPIFQKKPTVFISYAHEEDLKEQVKELADWLAERSVEVITDHKYQYKPPSEGWSAWMQHSIEDADIVLIVCTERYKALFEKREVDVGGYGVTWEGAIIKNDLYQGKMRNDRFYPVLPELGEDKYIPAILYDWSNGHRFPSGNEGILRLVNPNFESTISSETPQLQAQLQGPNDSRLFPREIEVIGRDHEIKQVVAFLNGTQTSASVSGYVAGSGGIGKTELCKAALRKWLQDNPDETAYWLEIDDNADNQRFLDQLAEAIGLSDKARAKINSFSQLQQSLPEGLYYLDNLENVVESDGGRKTLKAMVQTPGIRVLASSRVSLDRIFSTPFKIDHLDEESAYLLFIQSWTGDTDDLEEQAVKTFVMNELGGHALSIVLMAYLGDAYSWISLLGKWQKKGTKLLKADGSSDRQDNLELSFDITREHLSKYKGALDLWQFIALFPDGVDSDTLDIWEELTGFDGVRQKLVKHNLIAKKDHKITMLPPVSRYGLSDSAIKNKKGTGFNWSNVRNHFYQYFLSISELASEIASSEEKIASTQKCAQEFWAMQRFLLLDKKVKLNKKKSIQISNYLLQLNHQLRNAYQHNVLAGRAVVAVIRDHQPTPLSEQILGDLESRLGNVEQARAHYDKAIELYQKEQAKLGLANVYQSLGEVAKDNNQLPESDRYYQQAQPLFEKEQAVYGQADIYRLKGGLDYLNSEYDEANINYQKALDIYRNIQSQMGEAYVLKGQADIFSQKGNAPTAMMFYGQALDLFQKEQYPSGAAKTLIATLKCEAKRDILGQGKLSDLAEQAWDAARRSSLPPVMDKAREAIVGVFGDGFDFDKLGNEAAEA